MPSALIIGAGPAGSCAGVCLARGGWHVTLLEQHPFPRDKVCGECLSSLGAAVLRRLGLEAILATASRLPYARLHAADGRSATITLPQPCWGLSRRSMDDALLAAARQAGVTVLQPVRAEALDASAGGLAPAVQVRDLRENRVTRLQADYVLLADGKSALVGGKPPATGDLGVKAHFTDVDGPRDAVELFALDGHYVGLSPVEPQVWNLALSLPAVRMRQVQGDLDRLLRAMCGHNRALRTRLTVARRVGPWLSSPLPRFPVHARRWPEGVIPIGNAAAALEPIGGEGMGLAMRSGEMAATALLAAAQHGQRVDFAQLAGGFDRLWRWRARACRGAAMLLSTDWLAGAAVELLDGHPVTSALAVHLIGKR